ncbi:hypothetical protein [uncultured Methylobacterium sp.]|nr:hypothetical protein [uncultured Methylobacterium sp.]
MSSSDPTITPERRDRLMHKLFEKSNGVARKFRWHGAQDRMSSVCAP